MTDVELGLACAEVHNALDQRLGELGELSGLVREAIKHLTL